MADVQNIITLGIGSAPGHIRYFILLGLDVNPVTVTPTPDARTATVAPETRSVSPKAGTRSIIVAAESRSVDA